MFPPGRGGWRGWGSGGVGVVGGVVVTHDFRAAPACCGDVTETADERVCGDQQLRPPLVLVRMQSLRPCPDPDDSCTHRTWRSTASEEPALCSRNEDACADFGQCVLLKNLMGTGLLQLILFLSLLRKAGLLHLKCRLTWLRV